MRSVVFTALASALLLAEAQAQASTGDGVCNCIDPFALGLTRDGVAIDPAASCVWTNNGTCYPATYGASECLAHDKLHDPLCAGSSVPTWCETSWCYVDPAACERPYTSSSWFGNVLMASGEPLSYSYATCGNLDYYNRGEQELRNLGRRLRVSWASIDSSTGYTKVAAPDGNGVVDSTGKTTGVTGAIVQFMADLFEYYGIEWEFVPVSAESQAFSASDVTNCIHEVAINRTDMCWFDSWLLDTRLELTTMIPIFTDSMKVMVRKQGKETLDFAGMLQIPFSPFTWQLWLVVVGQYICSYLVMYVLEGQANDDDFPDSSVKGGVGESIFRGSVAAFGGGLLLAPKTYPGKIIMAGLSLSLLVFMSIYGAQVTTALVESRLSAPTGSMTSFEEGLSRGAKFCVYSFTADFIRARWPTMQIHEVGAGGKVYELFDALYNGTCEGSLIIDNWWSAAQTGIYSSNNSPLWDTVYKPHMQGIQEEGWRRFHCDDKIFPLASLDVPWSIGNGIPVREELVRIIRVAIKKAQDDTRRAYNNYEDEYRQRFVQPAPGCESSQGVSVEEEVAATLEDGVGATMVTVFACILSVMWFGVEQLVSRKRQESAVDSAKGGESEASGAEEEEVLSVKQPPPEEAAAAQVRGDPPSDERWARMQATLESIERRLDRQEGALGAATRGESTADLVHIHGGSRNRPAVALATPPPPSATQPDGNVITDLFPFLKPEGAKGNS